jgi:hypothetical protein
VSADLRQRLARFDRARTRTAPLVVTSVADPLEALYAAGAEWCGRAPSGYLRRELPLPELPGPGSSRLLGPDESTGDRALVFDTETTGLESGTGTLVFLVGFVRWGDRSRLIQYFLPEPAGEAAFLEAVAEELRAADWLLSYNGKGFDLPRLRSRMRLHRRDVDVLGLPHVDLLHPVRRLVKGWLPDARLKTVEEAVLGRAREDDLAGEFAPAVYRDLQLDRRDSGLAEVLRHNALDVENLPALARRVSEILEGRSLNGLPADAALPVGRSALARGEDQLAGRALLLAVRGGGPATRGRARRLLAGGCRRAGRYREAARHWREQIEDQPSDLSARVELAKLHEHRFADPVGALALVEEAKTLQSLRPDRVVSGGDDLDHRRRRLLRKLGKV